TNVASDQVCGLIAHNWAILAGYKLEKGRPKIFASDDEVLREANAIYLHNTELRWLDVGTLASALGYCDTTGPKVVAELVGDPVQSSVAKGLILLKSWWIDRVRASENARKPCTVYSAADRVAVWEAFSAGQQFNNDAATSMDTYQALLTKHVAGKIGEYREVARLALRLVFPDDTVLSPVQRAKVLDALEGETAFGVLPDKLVAMLDEAQATRDGPAAKVWRAALAAEIQRIGGNYADGERVRPDDEAAIRAMFEE